MSLTARHRTASLSVAALTVAALSCGRDPFYEPIPNSNDFPLPESVIADYVRSNDVSNMRKHAWKVFAGATAPSKAGIARFETWFSSPDLFTGPPCEAGRARPAVLHGPFDVDLEIAEKGVGALTRSALADAPLPKSVHFSLELCEFIQQNKLADSTEFQRLADRGIFDVAKLAETSTSVAQKAQRMVATKANWLAVPKDGSLVIKVWDSVLSYPGATTIVPPRRDTDKAFRTVCVARDQRSCAGTPQATYHPLDDFYHADLGAGELASFKNALGCSDAPESSRYCRMAGLDAILIALHVSTREQPNWVWATFWWHDRPTEGPYAAGRPKTVKTPWDRYLMNVSYDMDDPREPDGAPHIAFNPWLEGSFQDGISSNCMTCHRRATWNLRGESCFTVVQSDGSLNVHADHQKVVVRGSRAASATYFNEPFDEQVKLGFIWALQAHSQPRPTHPECVQQ